MDDKNSFRVLLEKVKAETEIQQIKLPVLESKLSPVLSKENLDIHYGILYKNYVKKALSGEGDYQIAGAKLHTLFFEQLQEPKENNQPSDEIKDLIVKKFDSFVGFKKQLTELALSINGSGWVYLTTSGSLKIIENHKDVPDIALIIDMWEHSFLIDYGADKEQYLKEMWKIINWSIINSRIK